MATLPSLSGVPVPQARFGGPFTTIGTEVRSFLENRAAQQAQQQEQAMQQALLALRARGVAQADEHIGIARDRQAFDREQATAEQQRRADERAAATAQQQRTEASQIAEVGEIEEQIKRFLPEGAQLPPLSERMTPEARVAFRRRQLERFQEASDLAQRLKSQRAGKRTPEEEELLNAAQEVANDMLRGGNSIEDVWSFFEDSQQFSALSQEDRIIAALGQRRRLKEQEGELTMAELIRSGGLPGFGVSGQPQTPQQEFRSAQLPGVTTPPADMSDVRQQAPASQQEIIVDAIAKSVLAELGIADFSQLSAEQQQRVAAVIQQRIAMRGQQ